MIRSEAAIGLLIGIAAIGMVFTGIVSVSVPSYGSIGVSDQFTQFGCFDDDESYLYVHEGHINYTQVQQVCQNDGYESYQTYHHVTETNDEREVESHVGPTYQPEDIEPVYETYYDYENESNEGDSE